MKSFFLFLSTVCAMSGVCAQTSVPETNTDRQRIAEQRQAVQDRYDRAMLQCKGLFAQTDCEKRAGKQRRTELQVLRTQEKQLNDQERQRKAAEQQARVAERAKAAAQRDQKPTSIPQTQSEKSAVEQEAAIQAQLRSEQRHEAKLRQAQQHREKSEQSLKNKPPKALPLPTPDR